LKDAGNLMLLVGAKGMLAKKVDERFSKQWEITPVDLPDFDLTDRSCVLAHVSELQPDLIVNCAAFTDVDGCETQEELATRVNGLGVGYLAEAASRCGATLVHLSTDYVFSGQGKVPLDEMNPVGPQTAYGRSKLAGEEAIFASGLENFYIVRTSWLYGPGGANFVETILRLAKRQEELGIVADQVGSPTYTGDLADALFVLTRHLLEDPAVRTGCPSPGIYHYSNEGVCSWYEFACAIVDIARGRGELLCVRDIKPIKTEDYPLPARRPAYSVLSKEKFRHVTGEEPPCWRSSLDRYFDERLL